jgi:diguanylate cyclase (GGDEF)-like protein
LGTGLSWIGRLQRADETPIGRAGQVPAALARSLDDPRAKQALELITRDVTVKTGAEAGALACWKPTERGVGVICAAGAAPTDDRSRLAEPGQLGFVGRVLESGRAVVEAIDPDLDPILGVAASGARLTLGAGAAIRPPGGPAGALCVAFASVLDDAAAARWLIERYAGLAALCLYDPSILDGRLATPRLDDVTCSATYDAIHAELVRVIARSKRHRRSVSCCIVGLDGFERVSGREDHAHDEQTLVAIAESLQAALRISDTVTRYRRDAFVAILPGTDENAARGLAERLRSTVSATAGRVRGERFSASVGITQWRSGSTAAEMLAATDQALHRAQALGGAIALGGADLEPSQ